MTSLDVSLDGASETGELLWAIGGGSLQLKVVLMHHSDLLLELDLVFGDILAQGLEALDAEELVELAEHFLDEYLLIVVKVFEVCMKSSLLILYLVGCYHITLFPFR